MANDDDEEYFLSSQAELSTQKNLNMDMVRIYDTYSVMNTILGTVEGYNTVLL